MRRFHRWLGVGSTVIILLAVLTGLLWAYAPHLYWEDGYLERKHPPVFADYGAVTLTHQDAIRLARQQLGPEAIVSTITLRSELGAPLFEVSGKNFTVLIDAHTGAVLSPLTPPMATRIAAQYVRGAPPVASTTLLEQFLHRSGKTHQSVYRVRFSAPKNPEIFVCALTGGIIEEQDEVRRFHFWIMRLHQLNFFGFRKTLTIVPGAAVLLLIISGLVLSRRAKDRSAEAALRKNREESIRDAAEPGYSRSRHSQESGRESPA